jgi:hypothetical protein
MPLPKLDITGADKCPCCGSTEIVASEYIEELKKLRYIPKETKATEVFNMQYSFPMAVASPLNIQQTMPIVLKYVATCAKCYCDYMTRMIAVEARMAPPGMRPGHQPPSNFPGIGGS